MLLWLVLNIVLRNASTFSSSLFQEKIKGAITFYHRSHDKTTKLIVPTNTGSIVLAVSFEAQPLAAPHSILRLFALVLTVWPHDRPQNRV